MKKTQKIIFSTLIMILPITSMAWVYFFEDIEAGRPFDITAEIMFTHGGDSITNYSSAIVGTNINIQLFTTTNNLGPAVINYDYAVIEIPAQPEGNYTIEVTITGNGSVPLGNIRDFSIPRLADWGDNPPIIFAVNGVAPTYTVTSNTFKYIHMQRSDVPINYTVETCTNLIAAIWIPHTNNITTNITGRTYDEIIHNISTKNTQTFVRFSSTYQ